MELKVWVEGVVRVVSGLSLNTCCQEVVLALAQSIGRTGRYLLVLKLRGGETPVAAADRPLQLLARLGRPAADVRFVLRRTGPPLGRSPESVAEPANGQLAPPTSAEPEPLGRGRPQKAFGAKANTTWSPSPPASPAAPPLAAPPLAAPPLAAPPLAAPPLALQAQQVEAFRNILQQQRRLEDLETKLEALEKETEFWELKVVSPSGPDQDLTEEVGQLELQFRVKEAELLRSEHWQQDLGEELDREQDMQRRLDQIRSSIEDQSYQVGALQSHSAHLQHDIRTRIQKQIAEAAGRHTDRTLDPLKLELLGRLRLGEELDSALRETQRDLDSAEERDRSETIQELDKQLRRCHLRHFIQQTGRTSPAEQTPPPVDHAYIRNAGILD